MKGSPLTLTRTVLMKKTKENGPYISFFLISVFHRLYEIVGTERRCYSTLHPQCVAQHLASVEWMNELMDSLTPSDRLK